MNGLTTTTSQAAAHIEISNTYQTESFLVLEIILPETGYWTVGTDLLRDYSYMHVIHATPNTR